MRVEVWGGAFSADVPEGWDVVELDDVVEIELLPAAAVHFSVYRRADDQPPRQGEALSFVQDFIDAPVVDEPVERVTSEGFAATSSYLESGPDGTHRWDVGARISVNRVVVYTYNDDGTRDTLRDQARAVFDSLRVA